jgi:hypothetical protein
MLSLMLTRSNQEYIIKVSQFIDKVKCYRYVWFHISDCLAIPLLNNLISSNVKFEWHPSHQQAIDKIKKVIGTEIVRTLLLF